MEVLQKGGVPMKIIVLGGAGDMGSRAVEELAKAEGVEQVTIADRNLEAAHQIANRLQEEKAKVDVKSVDANDHRAWWRRCVVMMWPHLRSARSTSLKPSW